jgi:hypothetical protein
MGLVGASTLESRLPVYMDEPNEKSGGESNWYQGFAAGVLRSVLFIFYLLSVIWYSEHA